MRNPISSAVIQHTLLGALSRLVATVQRYWLAESRRLTGGVLGMGLAFAVLVGHRAPAL